jgi:hypothetical protein
MSETGRPCRFCKAHLRWILSPLGGQIPCEEPAHVIHPERTTYHKMQINGDELHVFPVVGSLPKGKWFTAQGKGYSELEAPVGPQLWRSHWDKCPGAQVARKKMPKRRDRA